MWHLLSLLSLINFNSSLWARAKRSSGLDASRPSTASSNATYRRVISAVTKLCSLGSKTSKPTLKLATSSTFKSLMRCHQLSNQTLDAPQVFKLKFSICSSLNLVSTSTASKFQSTRASIDYASQHPNGKTSKSWWAAFLVTRNSLTRPTSCWAHLCLRPVTRFQFKSNVRTKILPTQLIASNSNFSAEWPTRIPILWRKSGFRILEHNMAARIRKVLRTFTFSQFCRMNLIASFHSRQPSRQTCSRLSTSSGHSFKSTIFGTPTDKARALNSPSSFLDSQMQTKKFSKLILNSKRLVILWTTT